MPGERECVCGERERERDRQTVRQTDRDKDIGTERDTQRETDTKRERERERFTSDRLTTRQWTINNQLCKVLAGRKSFRRKGCMAEI